MDTYCWIFSTFTIKSHLHGEVGKHNIAPGVGASRAIMVTSNSEEIIAHKYYQWVCIVLFVQAIFFYIPRYLWKIWEAGRLEMLVKDFGSPIVQSSWTTDYKDYLIKYLLNNSYVHNIYVIRYTVCEVLNFVNVVVQIFIMDWFLSGQFTGYGIALTAFAASRNLYESNPMSHVFPKLAKCTYADYGPSGSIQNIDALCVLPLNVVNEKLYVVLWFWFCLLSVISLLSLVYRVVVFMSKTVRSYLLMAQVRYLNKSVANAIVTNLSFGDWFVLYQIGKNVNPIIFQEFIDDLGNIITSRKHMNRVFQCRV
ncbi:Innexin 2 [Carabus blaptoides fortunei]